MRQRIYTDPSVIGSWLDEEFEGSSRQLFDRLLRGEDGVVISELTLLELEGTSTSAEGLSQEPDTSGSILFVALRGRVQPLYCTATSAGTGGFQTVMTTVQTRQDVIERLRRHREDLRRLGVERIGLFGSFQRDEPGTESDVDLLVEFAPGEKSFDHFMALSFLLEDELERSVELVTREALSPHLGPHILQNVEYVEIGD